MPIHRIPNFQFATWANRCQIHIFFPQLAIAQEPGVSRQLTTAQKTQFYELVLRPAITQLLPEDVSDWPPNYESELFRARKRNGHMAYQTKMIPGSLVYNLAMVIRQNLAQNGVAWTDGFFFTHTVRGVKHSTQHNNSDPDAMASLDEFIEDVGLSTTQGQWWIDVGLEIHSEDELCLQWRTSSHSALVQDVLEIEDRHAIRVTTLGSSKYQRDIVSHLMAVSGCRIEPGIRAQGPYEAVYLQMYTTDKAITYNPEGRHHGKAMTVDAAMGPKQPPVFVEGILSLFTSAMKMNASNARIEVRVPLAHATTVFTALDIDQMRQHLLAFQRNEWW